MTMPHVKLAMISKAYVHGKTREAGDIRGTGYAQIRPENECVGESVISICDGEAICSLYRKSMKKQQRDVTMI